MTAPIVKTETLTSLAKVALQQADGVVADAVAYLDEVLATDADLRRAVLGEAIKDAVRFNTSHAHLASRAQVIRQSTSQRSAVKALAGGIVQSLLDFPMLDGSPLRLADRDKVEAMIADYRKREGAARHRANWLSEIAPLIPAQGVVGDVLDADAAKQLWEKAQ